MPPGPPQHPDRTTAADAWTRHRLRQAAAASAVGNSAWTAPGAPPAATVSRFVGSAATRVPEQGQPRHETGEAFRARAAEERHTPNELAHAVRTVAGHSLDAGECEMLLAMLGLDAGDGARPLLP
jgi:hypothetical protein